ncbi:hypothetical protein K5V21_17225 [Clostridium sardiniense]|uniref:Uncharacterized protein n=1 Tax=Clostridium sardiniense TaxID=29369 RepID=A0ABS7L265_CLOSR|nr:hypothetical protein [Clostridium sardiniense]MBY0757175.1 hypothetical protein [Clostridium sardiniense]MDQ0461651.1 hypothetical protein [Clostridium sardiniense]
MAPKKGKEENQKQKLAKQILENKGINFDEWQEKQYQKVIDENVELLINSLVTSKELGE